MSLLLITFSENPDLHSYSLSAYYCSPVVCQLTKYKFIVRNEYVLFGSYFQSWCNLSLSSPHFFQDEWVPFFIFSSLYYHNSVRFGSWEVRVAMVFLWYISPPKPSYNEIMCLMMNSTILPLVNYWITIIASNASLVLKGKSTLNVL